jgi:hypothetical protein
VRPVEVNPRQIPCATQKTPSALYLMQML